MHCQKNVRDSFFRFDMRPTSDFISVLRFLNKLLTTILNSQPKTTAFLLTATCFGLHIEHRLMVFCIFLLHLRLNDCVC